MYQGINLGKRGQVTIFVLIGVAIVAAVMSFFLFATDVGRNINPLITTRYESVEEIREAFIECVKENDILDDKLEEILMQGGVRNPESHHRFNGVDIQYLCYTNRNLYPCSMNIPFPYKKIAEELEGYIEPEMESCVNKMIQNFERVDYQVVYLGEYNYEVKLIPDKILISTNVPLSINRKDRGAVLFDEKIEIEKQSGVYVMSMIATSILNYEARYGDADTNPYMLVYPNFGIEKRLRDDGTKIYTVYDRTTEERFSFAVRSWIKPPGYNL